MMFKVKQGGFCPKRPAGSHHIKQRLYPIKKTREAKPYWVWVQE